MNDFRTLLNCYDVAVNKGSGVFHSSDTNLALTMSKGSKSEGRRNANDVIKGRSYLTNILSGYLPGGTDKIHDKIQSKLTGDPVEIRI
jgi:hypothetical protein